MDMQQAQQIEIGDLVRWTDPDGGRVNDLVVDSICYNADYVTIWATTGSVIGALPCELQLLKSVSN